MFIDYPWTFVEKIQKDNKVKKYKGFRREQEAEAHTYMKEQTNDNYRIKQNDSVNVFGYSLKEFLVWEQTHKAESIEI